MYISVYDLVMFILFVIAVIVSGYFIAVLHRAFRIFGHVLNLLRGHGQDIRRIVALLPEVLANVNALAVSLKETADQTNDTFGALQDSLVTTVDDLRDGLESFAVYAKIIGEVVRSVFYKK